MILLSI